LARESPQQADVLAINGHGTARGIAGPYAALLCPELLSSALLREAVSVQCSGTDRIVWHENAWGLGFGLNGDGFGMGERTMSRTRVVVLTEFQWIPSHLL
jgi:hypothetical protein